MKQTPKTKATRWIKREFLPKDVEEILSEVSIHNQGDQIWNTRVVIKGHERIIETLKHATKKKIDFYESGVLVLDWV